MVEFALKTVFYLDYLVSSKSYLEKTRGSLLKKYFNNINLEEYVLRKITAMSHAQISRINIQFSEIEADVINNLINNGYLAVSKNNESVMEFEELVITDKGKEYLDKIQNEKVLAKTNKEVTKKK